MSKQLFKDAKSLRQTLTNIKNRKFEDLNESFANDIADSCIFVKTKFDSQLSSYSAETNIIFNHYLLQAIGSYNKGLWIFAEQATKGLPMNKKLYNRFLSDVNIAIVNLNIAIHHTEVTYQYDINQLRSIYKNGIGDLVKDTLVTV